MPSSDRLQAPFAEDAAARRRFGRYYTPSPLVDALHRQLAHALRAAQIPPELCTLIDPCCGPGAFLAAGAAAEYGEVLGLDLDAAALAEARRVAPAGAELLEGDAYGEGLEALCRRLAVGGDAARRPRPVAVIGNPPYVANSELLRSGRYHAVRDRLLPFARGVAKGTSIRDDYVLFFGVADRLIEAAGGCGAIGFVTSASFVDNFLYAPLRRWLLGRYRLQALVELGPKLFEGARVATAYSVWVRDEGDGRGDAGDADVDERRTARAFGHARLSGSREERLEALARGVALAPAQPHGPSLLLHAPEASATALLEAMRAAGDPIGGLFALHSPGLKTRYEELLVDGDRARLMARMAEFFEARDPDAFARAHAIPEATRPKLLAAFEARRATRFSRAAVRPFARYAGRPHRFQIPASAMAWAYVDPALIPRGDHRFRGSYDPHLRGPKLVFNVREVPLSAAVVHGPTCVHDYRHARFAPLHVPRLQLELFATKAERGAPPRAPEDASLNLTPAWAEAAQTRFDDPSDLLYYVAAIVNSRLVQEQFAPIAGATEEVPIPRLDAHTAPIARRLAAVARALGPGADLDEASEADVRTMFGLVRGQ